MVATSTMQVIDGGIMLMGVDVIINRQKNRDGFYNIKHRDLKTGIDTDMVLGSTR